jgi:hypothetical protein
LRQRVELPAVNARRDEVVASAFRRGLGQNGRFDLVEFQVRKRCPRPLQQPVAQRQVALQLGTPQVQMPVQQPQLLRRRVLSLGAPYRYGQRFELGGTHHFQPVRMHLDVTGHHFRVARIFGPARHLPLNQDHGLGRHLEGALHHFRSGPVGTKRDLHDSVPVAHVEEHQPAQVAPPVDPAAEPHPRTDVGRAERTAAVRAHRSGCHSPL